MFVILANRGKSITGENENMLNTGGQDSQYSHNAYGIIRDMNASIASEVAV